MMPNRLHVLVIIIIILMIMIIIIIIIITITIIIIIIIIIIINTLFLKKKLGILQLPPSVRPTVHHAITS